MPYFMRNKKGLPVVLGALLMAAQATQAGSRPDLAASIMADRFQVFPGEGLGVRIRVVNYGGGGRTPRKDGTPLDVVVVLSSDRRVALPIPTGASGRFREDRALQGSFSRWDGLPPRGDELQRRVAVGIPADTPPGRWWLCSVVDPANRIAESNERNNVTCKELLVQSPERTRDGRSPSEPARKGTPDRSRNRKEEVISDLLGRIFRVPESSAPAETKRKESRRNSKERGRVGNEAPPASACRAKGPLPDLEATALKMATRLSRGAEKRFNLRVRNQGRGSAPGFDGRCGYQVHIVLSPRNGVELPRNGRYAPGVQVLHRITRTSTLPAGQRMRLPSDQRQLRVGNIPAGRYWLCLVVDPYNGVEESDETNNARCEYPVTVR